jgi:2-hydroxychromene-2-carboxylate isomerase
MKRRPRVYFSLRSPYSWLAIALLRRELPDLFTAVDMIPYWDPDERTRRQLAEAGAGFHYREMSKAKALYLLQDTKRLAHKLGLALHWPIDRDPWWELPSLGWLVARDHGVAEAFYDALTSARWLRGENICDLDVVARAASAAGLDPAEVLAAADSPAWRAAGTGCLIDAWNDDVFGVPYFMVGRQRFWGLDRVDDFLTALTALTALAVLAEPAVQLNGGRQRLPSGTTQAEPGTGIGYDTDAAGGCG